MKRGKLHHLIPIVLIFSLSIISAGLLGDVFDIFESPSNPTAYVVDGGEDETACIDQDGYNNFFSDSSVIYDGKYYYDYCNGNTAFDYYCESSAGEGSGGITINLPLLNRKITGFATGDLPVAPEPSVGPPKTYINCETTYGLECIGGGLCGCDSTQTYSCEASCGVISSGTYSCSNGELSSTCIAQQTETEICDGWDNDCDGNVDENTCPVGQTCDPIAQRCTISQSQCVDLDGDGYEPVGAGTCTDLPDTDCNDDDADIHPGATEVCGYYDQVTPSTGYVDNDCDGLDDIDDTDAHSWCDERTSGQNPSCNKEDNEGNLYYSCGTTQPQCNPSAEICDGIDNDCDNLIDEDLTQVCGFENLNVDNYVFGGDSICTQGTKTCTDGEWSQCSGEVLPKTSEICDNNLDDNCANGVDEGCSTGCTEGEVISCNPSSNVCEKGEQICSGGIFGDCKSIGIDSACSEENTCLVGSVTPCGSNAGICTIGVKTCKSDGTWGECSAEESTQEICSDNIDNDCDSVTDELDCVIKSSSSSSSSSSNSNSETTSETSTSGTSDSSNENTPTGSQQNQESSTSQYTSSNKDYSGFLGFIRKVFKIIGDLFSVLKFMGQPIAEIPNDHCTDSDSGINYFQKGTGKMTEEEKSTWFVDFCYEGTESNQVTKCTGDNCYLKEYSCSTQGKINSESKINCQFGCVNGGCIPDSSLSDECEYFDKETFKFVNVC